MSNSILIPANLFNGITIKLLPVDISEIGTQVFTLILHRKLKRPCCNAEHLVVVAVEAAVEVKDWPKLQADEFLAMHYVQDQIKWQCVELKKLPPSDQQDWYTQLVYANRVKILSFFTEAEDDWLNQPMSVNFDTKFSKRKELLS